MKIGLVIGKFMPLHYGHIHLIDFGLKQCDVLKIALVVKPDDRIPMEIRLEWLNWLKESRPNIEIDVIDEQLPRTEVLEEHAANAWIEYFSKRFSSVNIIFSSEDYGLMLAQSMNIEHVFYDAERKKTNISGREIRHNPSKHMEYVPKIVQDYLIAMHIKH